MSQEILSHPLYLSRTEIGRIFSRIRVDPSTGCWVWTGPFQKDGYGGLNFRKRKVLAHRLLFAWLEEPLPLHKELELHHVCRNRACVNPSHCELVSRKEHIYKDGTSPTAINGLKTHCPRCGGEFVPRGHERGRRCPACNKEIQHKWHEAHPDYQKEWREAHPEHQREYQRKRREANREKMREYDRAYYWANREKLREYQKARYHAKKGASQ